jgi:hypothetical protein
LNRAGASLEQKKKPPIKRTDWRKLIAIVDDVELFV